jgi:DNA-binding MarR family transcriptional regulator
MKSRATGPDRETIGINGYDRSLQSDPRYRVWVLISRVRESLMKLRAKELAEYRFSPVEARALIVLGDIDAESVTPADLARRMNRTHWTVTALIGRMQKKGLLQKVRVPGTGRTWHVELTPDGEDARQQALLLLSIHNAMSGLSDEDLQHFEFCLKNVYDQTRRLLMDDLDLQ